MLKLNHLPIMMAALMLLTVPAGRAAAKEESEARRIFKKAIDRNAFGFEGSKTMITIILKNRRGDKRTRRIITRAQKEGGVGRSLVCFYYPNDVNGTSFLSRERKNGDDDQYLYLPSLNRLRRISGSQKSQKFMSTEFTYSDMESKNIDDATYKKLEDGKVRDTPCHVIEATPKPGKDTQYSRYISWIGKKDYFPRKFKFYDKNNKHLKTLSIRPKWQGKRQYAWRSRMKNYQNRNTTYMTIEAIDFSWKANPKDEAGYPFTKAYLKRGGLCLW